MQYYCIDYYKTCTWDMSNKQTIKKNLYCYWNFIHLRIFDIPFHPITFSFNQYTWIAPRDQFINFMVKVSRTSWYLSPCYSHLMDHMFCNWAKVSNGSTRGLVHMGWIIVSAKKRCNISQYRWWLVHAFHSMTQLVCDIRFAGEWLL